MGKYDLPVIADKIDDYIYRVNRFPILTEEEEFELFNDYKTNGNKLALHKLLLSTLRHVIAITWRYRWVSYYKDLIQEGNLALSVAVNTYDVSKNVRFSYYAQFYIKALVHNYLIKNSKIISGISGRHDREIFFNSSKMIDKIIKDNNNSLTKDEICQEISQQLDIPIEELRTNYHILNRLDAGFNKNDKFDYIKENDNMIDVMPSNSDVESDLIYEDNIRVLQENIELLSDREKYIITNRFLLGTERTYKEIGAELGITKQRVAQIEDVAIKKIKNSLDNI
jgi:RNA polymerase sigma-32 factor